MVSSAKNESIVGNGLHFPESRVNQKAKEKKPTDDKKPPKPTEKRAPVKQIFAEDEHFSQNTRPIYAN